MNMPADRMPADRPPVNPPSGNAAMRYLFLFVLGLVIGAVATVMAMRALDARKDHFPDSVMHVFGAHMGMLGGNAKANRCAATDTLPHLQALRTLANDIEPAFVDLRDDTRFAAHASELRARLDRALANPPLNCEGVQAAMSDIGDGCKACHRDFRN
jgi:cytochrome c556